MTKWNKYLAFVSTLLGSAVLASCDELSVQIVSPTNGQRVRSTQVRMDVRVVDATAVAYTWQLDGKPVACKTVSEPVIGGIYCPAPEGEHTIAVTALDSSFRTGRASVRFVVDLPLAVTLDSVTNGQWLSTTTPRLTFSTTNATGAVNSRCQLDSAPAFPCASPVAYSPLSKGPHRLTVTASDTLDTSSDTVPFFVNAGDGPEPIAVQQVSAGLQHTCALLANGKVRCWGANDSGQLGYGNRKTVGYEEFPASAGDVNVGGDVIQISAGAFHTCALLGTGNVRCWGLGTAGQLGYGRVETIGDDEVPASAGDVNVGARVVQIGAGESHTCALLTTRQVRCWGASTFTGHATTQFIGDDESPASARDVNVGGSAIQIAAGGRHSCALLDTGKVRCWGMGTDGMLGYGNTNTIGDDESPASAGDVDVGGRVVQISVDVGRGLYNGGHTCALLDAGSVRCWGSGSYGILGYGNTQAIGDNESPSSAGDVDVGGAVKEIAVGTDRTCALLTHGGVRCWGYGGDASGYVGVLGYGNTESIGDNEPPSAAGDVDVGGVAAHISAGASHTCALLTNGRVRCWGVNRSAQLGYVNLENLGDDEAPASANDVVVGY